MSEQYNKLIKTLKTIFEMEKADLDFGIYRIMNQKRDEINRFLRDDLLSQVNSAFDRYKSSGESDLHKELAQKIEDAKEMGVSDPENAPPVLKIKEKIAASVDTVALENEVYSHLHKFFSRYYDQGDFISKRRYKADTYAIPYEGEEVKLHWANYDQYYIKSSEHLRDYAFTIPTKDEDGKEKSVRIKLVEADTEKDNVKAKSGDERKFVLDKETPLSIVDGELLIHFHYVPAGKKKQTKLNEEAVATIEGQEGVDEWLTLLNQPAPTEKDKDRTLLGKHLNEYTARNTFDYFIHKDLGGFLRRELDFYIKNEVMFLDDIGHIEDDKAQEERAFVITEQQIRKIKVIRTIAEKIVQMLAQLEDFQKKLWLKKKFVVETNYCITLDRVPVELYGKITDCLEQHAEWVGLGFTAEETEITEDYLKENPYLVLDTKFFDDEFKAKLLASIGNFDEQCDGLLINSDNIQALLLFKNKYNNRIDAVYIDPPYNTGPSEIIYKNNFKHSSWMSLMIDRMKHSKGLLKDNACYSIAIDDLELSNLCSIVDDVFIEYDRNMVVVNHHPQGGMSHNISRTHEYMLMMTPKGLDVLQGKKKETSVEYRSYMLSGPGDNKSRNGRPNSFYAILVDEINNKIVGFEPPPKIGEDYPLENTYDGYSRKYPINPNGEEKVWCRSYTSAHKGLENGEISITGSGSIKLVVDNSNKRYNLMSNWTDSKYNAGPHGTALVANMLGDRELFSYPKSIHTVVDSVESMTYHYDQPLIMDFFAGSATTGQAVIDLNREDGKKRKYILVEMGTHFNTATKPRMQKAIYAREWLDGKAGQGEGISQCFKYSRLESYEDTLNNLILKDPSKQQQDMLEESGELREEYMLGYWMDLETAGSPSLLNIEQFEDPFNYTLNIGTGSVGATKPTKVDLVETFNYLLGLTVRQIDTIRGFKVIIGANPKEESVAVIWRNSKEKSNEDLEAFLGKQSYNPRDTEYDHIYVNGDHTLEDPHSKVKMIEIEFKRLMFEVE